LDCSGATARQPPGPSLDSPHNTGGIPNRDAAAIAVLGPTAA